MEQVSRQGMTTASGLAGGTEIWGFCPKTPATGRNTSALAIALIYMVIPGALFLAKANVVSSTMLLVYLVSAIGLLSSVGVYIVFLLIRSMVLDHDHE